MIQTFVIPGRLDSLNDYIKAINSGPRIGNRLKRQNQDAVCWAIKSARLAPMGKVNVKFTWIEPNMKRDKDNIRTAAKFILDALVEMGIIPNDGWRHIGSLSDEFRVNKQNPRIVVELEEINNHGL